MLFPIPETILHSNSDLHKIKHTKIIVYKYLSKRNLENYLKLKELF